MFTELKSVTVALPNEEVITTVVGTELATSSETVKNAVGFTPSVTVIFPIVTVGKTSSSFIVPVPEAVVFVVNPGVVEPFKV